MKCLMCGSVLSSSVRHVALLSSSIRRVAVLCHQVLDM